MMMTPLDAAALMMTIPAVVPTTIATVVAAAAAIVAVIPAMAAIIAVSLSIRARTGPKGCRQHSCRDHDLADLHGSSFVTRHWV
jgi:hypothetical protein